MDHHCCPPWTFSTGISIEGDGSLPFTVGTTASIRCVSDSVATMIQWLDPSGVEVAMTTTGQTLDLPFTPVSDSLHNSEYTCRATRAEGIGEQNVTLTVTGEWRVLLLLSISYIMYVDQTLFLYI